MKENKIAPRRPNHQKENNNNSCLRDSSNLLADVPTCVS